MKTLHAWLSSILLSFLVTLLTGCISTSEVTPNSVNGKNGSTSFPGSTSTYKPTNTQIPIVTLNPKPTNTPVLTSQPMTIKIINQNKFPPDIVLLMKDFGSYFYVYDGDEGEIIGTIWGRKFIDWEKNGCSFLVHSANNDIELMDLEGNVLDIYFEFDTIKAINEKAYRGAGVNLSYDREWLWYYSIDGEVQNEMGEPYAYYEMMDIEVLSVDGQNGPYPITLNGGSWTEGSWSPNSEYIAYADLDDHRMLQLFVSDKFGNNRKQVSNFRHPSSFYSDYGKIDKIQWSPDGKKISLHNIDETGRNVWVFRVDGSDSEASIISHDRVALWLDPERIILYQISGGLDVYNVQKGEVETRLTEEQFPYINNIYPFRDNGLIGFMSFDENGLGRFNLYNHHEKTILSHRGISHIQYLTYWVATPSDFPGRQNCRK